jgi:type II secretory pathway pseudopilin PulG
MLFKKGAMFGLDARIALAIFGALSVISGAALYSAIQDSKATALLTEMQEIAKAWEAYYLDTGNEYPSPLSASGLHAYISKLVEDTGEAGWQGPYLSYAKSSSVYLEHPVYQSIRLDLFTTDNAWGDAISPVGSATGKCTTGLNCFLWVTIFHINDDALVKAIDSKVDGSDGFDKGNFRVYTADSSGDYIYLRVAPVKNPS